METSLQPIVVWILTGIISGAAGLISYLLIDIRSSMKDKSKEQDAKIEALERELSRFKESLPRNYVMRDDYLRALTGVEMKTDQLAKEVRKRLVSALLREGGGQDE